MKRFVPWLMVVGTLFVLAGCSSSDKNPSSPTDPAGAQFEANAGDDALGSGDVAAANTHYKAALTKDPTNPHANLGAAVTEVYLLESDPEITPIINGLNGVARRPGDAESEHAARMRRLMGPLAGTNRSFDPISNGQLVGSILMRGAEDPVTVSQVQNVIRLRVLPKLAYVEARLNIIETHPNFNLRLPPAITDEPDTLEIDLGEVYALDVVLNGVQAWLQILVAYNFDGATESANPESLLAAGTDFGTLHQDGAAQLAFARGNFLQVKTRLDDMTEFIGGETDDQSDDVIPSNALSEPGFMEFWDGIQTFCSSLSAPVAVDATTYEGAPMVIQIEIGEFFSHPITDWKTKLPDHTFDKNHEPVISNPVTFPDPTFNGVFPKMTNDDWRALIGPVGPPV